MSIETATAGARSRPPRQRVSIVMPVLDEELRIVAALERVLSLAGVHEVIVVDGGSTDSTAPLVERCTRATLLRAPRGRASQMNAGVRAASGDVVLFLHADVRLPRDALTWVDAALDDTSVVAGAFRTWTVADGPRPGWAPLLHLADLRSRYTRLPYGDQAVFVRTDAFRSVGGFAEIELMEDLELSRRLSALGRIRTVRGVVRVSGRRFVARPLFYLAFMSFAPLLYRLGVPPKRLGALYGRVR